MRKGFTLIELLIVVAIIAILAAIAIPNFLQAQVRAKVARVKADMRSLATAIESYVVDHNIEPPDGYWTSGNYENNNLRAYFGDDSKFYAHGYWAIQPILTTPISYLSDTSNMVDPFTSHKTSIFEGNRAINIYRYKTIAWTWGEAAVDIGLRGGLSIYIPALQNNYMGRWCLMSDGPDGIMGPPNYLDWSIAYKPELGYPVWEIPYDPTNGVISDGDIQRSQMHPDGRF